MMPGGNQAGQGKATGGQPDHAPTDRPADRQDQGPPTAEQVIGDQGRNPDQKAGPMPSYSRAGGAGGQEPHPEPAPRVKTVKVQPSAADTWRPADEGKSQSGEGMSGGGKGKAVPKDGY